MNALDKNLQSLFPTVMVPRFEPLAQMTANGQRLLAAKDGLWLEVRRSWLHLRLPLSSSPIPLPYGTLEATVQFAFGQELLPLIRRFEREARAAFPLEHAAWLVWDAASERLDYESVRITSQGRGYVRYERPGERPGRLPCVDLHSHGAFPAGFSATDDTDDDDTKLAIVFGNCDLIRPSVAARLCVQGTHHDFSEWVNALLYTGTYEAASTTTDAACDQ